MSLAWCILILLSHSVMSIRYQVSPHFNPGPPVFHNFLNIRTVAWALSDIDITEQ